MTVYTPSFSVRAISVASTLLVSVMSAPLSATQSPGEAHFEVRTAYTELLDDGVYYLNADIDYGLSGTAIEALQSGVKLTVRIQIEVSRQRRMWFDSNIASLSQSYQLRFHPLSRRYIITNQTTGEARSFSSYSSAMATLGTISDFPVIDSDLLSDGRYIVRMRVVIDPEDLPRPLNLVAYFFSDWELVSEWYEWILKS